MRQIVQTIKKTRLSAFAPSLCKLLIFYWQAANLLKKLSIPLKFIFSEHYSVVGTVVLEAVVSSEFEVLVVV